MPALHIGVSMRRAAGVTALFAFAACKNVEPVVVRASSEATPRLAAVQPSDIAVLPVEDGTPEGTAAAQLTSIRNEVMRQLPDRRYAPLTALTVDLALKRHAEATNASAASNRESILAPARMKALAGHCGENATFALRVEQWDESRLMSEERIHFHYEAAMVGIDGQPLWTGSLQGVVKAGGARPAPRDRDSMTRSCIELSVRELLQRLPAREPKG